MMTSIADRWTSFMAELEDLCDEVGREIPTVIAVSKTRSMEEVREAIDLGIHEFGENYPDQFRQKAEHFPEQNWHFIGSLQRNKAEEVVTHAACIHTLDRKKLTRRLRYFDYSNPCFIQVNISGEASKSGIAYDAHTVEDLRQYSVDEGLPVIGLMTIGNPVWNASQTQQEFDKFVAFGHSLGLDQFSLGMTGDWQHAVRAGSTHLRVGTAIFGERN